VPGAPAVSWLELAVLALAAFRLTHLVVADTITAPIRAWFGVGTEKDSPRRGPLPAGYLRRVAQAMLGCFWCAGIWVSALILVVYHLVPALAWPTLVLFAVAGIQGWLHAAVVGFARRGS